MAFNDIPPPAYVRPLRPIDRFWTERMVMGVLIIGGFIITGNIVLVLLAMGKSIPETTAATILSGFTAAIGVIVGATFRNDRIDRINAESAAVATGAMANALPPAPPAPPTPVVVTNDPDNAVPVADTPPNPPIVE